MRNSVKQSQTLLCSQLLSKILVIWDTVVQGSILFVCLRPPAPTCKPNVQWAIVLSLVHCAVECSAVYRVLGRKLDDWGCCGAYLFLCRLLVETHYVVYKRIFHQREENKH